MDKYSTYKSGATKTDVKKTNTRSLQSQFDLTANKLKSCLMVTAVAMTLSLLVLSVVAVGVLGGYFWWEIASLQTQLQQQSALHGYSSVSNNTNGVTYIRWGSNICSNDSILVYSGRAGGTYDYTDYAPGSRFGQTNLVCLPEDPDFYNTSASRYNYLQGVVYGYPVRRAVPCAVCSVSTRHQLLMIPAKLSCPTGWTEEYEGYLMSLQCLDYNQTAIQSDTAVSGAYIYHYRAECGSLPCGPYSNDNEVTCVVCTK